MTTSKKLLVIAASALALATGVKAQVAIGGYAAASWTHTSGAAADRLDIDSALLKFSGDSKPVSGVVSLFYAPSSAFAKESDSGISIDSDIHVLDAYVNWNMGSGWSLTGGRFLSWLGYESFFAVNNPEITGANTVAGFIPGYEEGLRLTYTEKDWNAGFGVVDSAYNVTALSADGKNVTALRGDGEWKSNYAIEAYFSYGGIKDLTVWLGFAYETQPAGAKAKATIDFWAQYQVSKELYVAGEFTVEDNVAGATADSETWLILANYMFDDKVSVAARVSGDTNNGAVVDDVKWTLAPTYTVSKNFSVRGEISYLVNSGKAAADATSVGVQGIFRF